MGSGPRAAAATDPHPNEGGIAQMTDPTPADPAPEVPWSAPAAPAPAVATTPAMVYADVPNRIIAYIIDIIVIAVISIAIGLVLAIVGISVVSGSGTGATTNWLGTIILTAVGLAISGAYFVYSWSNQRATIGMKALGLQIGDAPGGATITTNQAIRRWLALGAAFSIAQALTPLPLIGVLIGFAAFGWVIFLLYTTWKSPTKQGWHDVFANTMIVKATKAAG
jgi:uncharacterized RDD family membrane protein YckC